MDKKKLEDQIEIIINTLNLTKAIIESTGEDEPLEGQDIDTIAAVLDGMAALAINTSNNLKGDDFKRNLRKVLEHE